MENRFLSRKQKRKLERKQKKEKRDLFYRNKKEKRKESINSNKSNNSNLNEIKNNKNEKKIYKKKEKNNNYNLKENKTTEIENKIENDLSDSDDLDEEIKYLEDKLKLKDKNKMEKFNKKIASENYDEDLMDFLDNIDNIKNKDAKTYKKYSSQKSKNLLDEKKEDKINNKIKQKEKLIENDDESENSNEIKQMKTNNNKIKIKDNNNNNEKNILNKNIEKENTKNEIILKFKKEITSLLNKIAETNISIIIPELFKKISDFSNHINNDNYTIFEIISNISLNLLLNQQITNLPITSCICSFLSIMHFKFGNNFIYFYIKILFEKILYFSDLTKTEKFQIKNSIFQIILFYLFNNITSHLIYDLIKFFIENFNEFYSEFLLLLLSYTGIEIRKEDPENLKIISTEVNKKYNNLKIENYENLSKIKFIVEMIEDIKLNKYLKFNLNEKFQFFKNFINKNINNDIKKGEKIEINLNDIKKINLNEIVKLNNNEIIETKNENELLNNIEINDELIDKKTNRLLEIKMKKMNINTNLKKIIFKNILTSFDITDCFEKLIRLNLKKEQKREIIKIILQLCIEEKTYNPFYELLLEKLITVDKNNKYTIHYCIWDYMKIFYTFKNNELKKIHNLSKLISNLLIKEKISLPVLLHFNFENSDENCKIFVIFIFDFYFEKSNENKVKLLFAKLIKNEDHIEWAKHLFQFLTQEFSNEIEIYNKNEEYQNNFSAAIKTLKKIL